MDGWKEATHDVSLYQSLLVFKKIVSVSAMKTIRSLMPLIILILIYGAVAYIGWRYNY